MGFVLFEDGKMARYQPRWTLGVNQYTYFLWFSVLFLEKLTEFYSFCHHHPRKSYEGDTSVCLGRKFHRWFGCVSLAEGAVLLLVHPQHSAKFWQQANATSSLLKSTGRVRQQTVHMNCRLVLPLCFGKVFGLSTAHIETQFDLSGYPFKESNLGH